MWFKLNQEPPFCWWAANRIENTWEKLQYDLYYIKNLSIALDLVIMFETVKTVILRKGAR